MFPKWGSHHLTLDEINYLNEMFLKVKSEYKLIEQRKVLKNIALIYLMEVKESINNIDIDKLEKSYFTDNLKSILIIVKAFQELNLINNFIIDLDSNLTVSKVLEIIKKIKFNKLEKEQAKKLIKQI